MGFFFLYKKKDSSTTPRDRYQTGSLSVEQTSESHNLPHYAKNLIGPLLNLLLCKPGYPPQRLVTVQACISLISELTQHIKSNPGSPCLNQDHIRILEKVCPCISLCN